MLRGAFVNRKRKSKQSHSSNEVSNFEVEPELGHKAEAHESGATRRGHLGIFVADQNVGSLGFGTSGKPPQRMFVASVKPGGWAESKDIIKDDEVLALDRQQVSEMAMDELKGLMKKRPLEISIRFQGNDCEELPRFKQTVAEQLHQAFEEDVEEEGADAWTSVAGEDIDHLGFGPSAMPPDRVYLTSVEEGSWADSEGLYDGIELVSLDGVDISELSAHRFKKLLKKQRPLELGFRIAPGKFEQVEESALAAGDAWEEDAAPAMVAVRDDAAEERPAKDKKKKKKRKEGEAEDEQAQQWDALAEPLEEEVVVEVAAELEGAADESPAKDKKKKKKRKEEETEDEQGQPEEEEEVTVAVAGELEGAADESLAKDKKKKKKRKEEEVEDEQTQQVHALADPAEEEVATAVAAELEGAADERPAKDKKKKKKRKEEQVEDEHAQKYEVFAEQGKELNVDPSSLAKLDVKIVGATCLRAADGVFSGKSDAYCACQITGKPETSFQTEIIKKTLNPTWNHSQVLDKVALTDSLHFQVYDWDKASKADSLGHITLQPSQIFPDGFDGEVDLLDDGKGKKAMLKIKIDVLSIAPDPQAVEKGGTSEKKPTAINIVSQKRNPALLAPGGYRMTVGIVGARNLVVGDAALGSTDPYCSCRLLGKASTTIRTQVLRNTLNPRWNSTAEIQGFATQDSLEFAVYHMNMDPKALSEELIGKVILPPQQFYPDGFDGELHLLDQHGIQSRQRLRVKVELQGAPVLEEPVSGKWEYVVIDPKGVQVYRTPRFDVRERLADGLLLLGHLTAVVEKRSSSEGIDFLRLAEPHGWVADACIDWASTGVQTRMEEVTREFGSWRYRVVHRDGAAFQTRLTTNAEAATGGGLRIGAMAVVTERVKVGEVMFLKVGSKGWLFDMSELGNQIMDGPLKEWGTNAPEGMEGEAIKRRQQELQWEMEVKMEMQRRQKEGSEQEEEVYQAQMWQWEQQRQQELLDDQRFHNEVQNFRLSQEVDDLQQQWDSYDQDVSDLLHASAMQRHEEESWLFQDQSEDPFSYINTWGDRSSGSPAHHQAGHNKEQQSYSVISDPVLATRVQLTVEAVESLSGGKNAKELAKTTKSKKHEREHEHQERHHTQFGEWEPQTDKPQEPGWSGLSNKLEDMDSAVDRLHWGPTVSGADTPFQRPKVGPIQTIQQDVQSAAALDLPGGLMGFQVRKLAQNLAGVCAGVFYWAAECDFSGQMRLQVLDLLLHHLRPCSHYDAGLTALWKDLEIEHARLTGQEWVAPEKVPAEWTPGLIEEFPRNMHKRRPKKKGHDSSFIFDDPVLISLLSWKKENHGSPEDDVASDEEGFTEHWEKPAETERRIDPEDGCAYTYKEFKVNYKGVFSKKEIREYWENCEPAQEQEGYEVGDHNEDDEPESPTFGAQAPRTKKTRQSLPQARPGSYERDRADFVRRTPSPSSASSRQRI